MSLCFVANPWARIVKVEVVAVCLKKFEMEAWRPGYAWELPGVAGNACNGLTPTVALQLAVVVYGANLFSEPLEDLEGYKRVCGRWSTTVEDLCDWRYLWLDLMESLFQTLDLAKSAAMEQRRFEESNGVAALDIHHGGVQTCRRYKVNEDSAWPLAPVWPGVRNPTFKV
eukprot:Gb_35481 [translate_table: standard]